MSDKLIHSAGQGELFVLADAAVLGLGAVMKGGELTKDLLKQGMSLCERIVKLLESTREGGHHRKREDSKQPLIDDLLLKFGSIESASHFFGRNAGTVSTIA